MALLEMRQIRKSFNGIEVLHGVELTVEEGEVHALLGENGAGKSTLMNILTGILQPDAGNICFNNIEFSSVSVKLTEKMGIAFVHQELNLFNDMAVYENIFLDKEITNKFGKCNKKAMVQKAHELFERLGVDIDPLALVENLTTSQKQLLEISKALFFDAKLLILDEPTTALNNEEVAHLFAIIRNLKKNGTSFIFISHKMPEIFELADRYTIFRNGEFVTTGEIKDTTPDEVTRRMVGESYTSKDFYEKRQAGDVILELSDYSGAGFNNINLQIKKGEIICFTGLQGSGSSELLTTMFGLERTTDGSMIVKGSRIRGNSVHAAMKAGVAMLASNRKENSVVPDMSILENMYLAEHTLSARKFPISVRQERRKYETYKSMLNIKAESEDDRITSLSGGNQQKVFIARWLNTDADILLFDNPTQGIDVGAKSEIYRLIVKLAQQGKTILVNTLEIPEIQKIADHCIVFYEGRIAAELSHEEITEATVMNYSTNAVGIQEESK
jgi:ribose transport system ATP-binding protein